MKTNNQLVDKSYAFSLHIVKLYRCLCEKKNAIVASKQILRSRKLIGANVKEVIGGQSKKDFQHKINIAGKEARETHYWLRLLRDSLYFDKKQVAGLINDCDELLKISGSRLFTLEKNHT
jgi:four helix bundle protein